MIANIFDYIIKYSVDVVAYLALFISAINTIINICSKQIKLKITQDTNEDAYNFNFTMFKRYNCIFFYLIINNLSREPVSISQIYMTGKRNKTLYPCHYELQDSHNDNGITLYQCTPQPTTILKYNLESDNLLNKDRVESLGSIKGFLTFLEEPIENCTEETFELIICTPKRKFKKTINVNVLPQDIYPENS